MTKVLFCTIVRDREPTIPSWHKKLKEISGQVNSSISVYENDSRDKSAEVIKSLNYDGFNEVKISSENINTDYYGSVVSDVRVKNLALARNKCIDQVEDLSVYDKLVFVEPDVDYDVGQAISLIFESRNYDILSGLSKLGSIMYDTWATRTEIKAWSPPGGHGFLIDAVPGIYPLASTFGGFCVYDMEPFVKGARFTWEMYGKADCDTACICDTFANMGYDNIAVRSDFIIRH